MSMLPLDIKIVFALRHLRIWHDVYNGSIFLGISGGKASYVLMHLAQVISRDIDHVFIQNGQILPDDESRVLHILSSRKHVIHRVQTPLAEFYSVQGYPIISKTVSHRIYAYQTHHAETFNLQDRWMHLLDAPFLISDRCCLTFWKHPLKYVMNDLQKVPVLGSTLQHSPGLYEEYRHHGILQFDRLIPTAYPFLFWRDKDFLTYARRYALPLPPSFQYGWQHTPCVGCGYGIYSRYRRHHFPLLMKTYPNHADYVMQECGWQSVLRWLAQYYGEI